MIAKDITEAMVGHWEENEKIIPEFYYELPCDISITGMHTVKLGSYS